MNVQQHFGVFDIMGPIMLGPSSSHTGGAARIGLLAGQLCRYNPKEIELDFYGALSATYRGHKTDVGIVGGLLGISIDDESIRDSLQIAKDRDIPVRYGTAKLEEAHPNTVVIRILDESEGWFEVQGYTVGGGLCVVERINSKKVFLDGKEQKSLTLDSGKKVTFEPIMDVRCRDIPFYPHAKELFQDIEKRNISMEECMIQYEMECSGCSKEEVLVKMEKIYKVMSVSVRKGQEEALPLLGHVFEGNAIKVAEWNKKGNHVIASEVSSIIRNVLAVMEVNGSMGKVATCPTAGACGILPATLFEVARVGERSHEQVIGAMFVASGIGMLIAQNATISGAVGGCQAEVGSASAMTAGAVVYLLGGNLKQIYSAAALALGNLIGLACDPVAGMVELPCIQRNVMGALNAVGSAEMALAGVDSVVSLDEVIMAMKEAGDLMHKGLRDTLGAGLSNTETARRYERKIFGERKMES